MPKDIEYESASIGDGKRVTDSRVIGLTRRQRHIGGLLFVTLGCYIIYRTFLAVFGLFPAPSIGQTWPKTKYMFVFGDSYSSIGYDVRGDHPTDANPFGNSQLEYGTSSGGPTWVHYLALEFNRSAMQVYDYAKWGATVQQIQPQVNTEFMPHAAQKPPWARWTAKNSLFFTWIGINDVSYMRNPPDQLRSLFQIEDQLYAAGARNFVFLTVPPFDRSVWGEERDPEGLEERVYEWNYYLPQWVDLWRTQHKDVQTAIYDTTYVFDEALDDPASHGFRNATASCDSGDCIWHDDLHPSYTMHRLLAARLASWLDRL